MTQLLEEFSLDGITPENIDEENGVIRNVKILGKVSKNKREYSEQSRDDAAKCYEGIGVNVDRPHPIH